MVTIELTMIRSLRYFITEVNYHYKPFQKLNLVYIKSQIRKNNYISFKNYAIATHLNKKNIGSTSLTVQ